MPGNADKHAPVLGILCCARRTHVLGPFYLAWRRFPVGGDALGRPAPSRLINSGMLTRVDPGLLGGRCRGPGGRWNRGVVVHRR